MDIYMLILVITFIFIVLYKAKLKNKKLYGLQIKSKQLW